MKNSEMKNTAFTMTFTPIAISIFCGVLLAVNDAIPVVPGWPLWGLLLVSMVVALVVITSLLLIGLVQWFMQYMNKPAV